MKKFIYLLIMVFATIACQEEGLLEMQKQSSTSGPPTTNITTVDSYVNSYTFGSDFKSVTITVDKSAPSAKDISHMIFKFNGEVNCTSQPITLDNVTKFTANGVDMMSYLGITEGQGTDCYGLLTDPFIKLGMGFSDPIVVFNITFNMKVMDGIWLIKAGSSNSPTGGGCFGYNHTNYSLARVCAIDLPVCYEDESAWGAGSRYVSRGNWATYTKYSTTPVNIYAGQNKWAGVLTMSPVTNGNVTLTITLQEGWSLQEVSNPVKIQGYSLAPSGNPSPGRFTTKGSSLTVTLPYANFYGVHLDVKQVVECPL